LEMSVRVLGRNVLGFVVGTSLAMSWILFQKIVNFILFYGFDIVEIYRQLIGFAARQLKADFDLTWAPVLLLLVIYILFGLLAVFIGMKIGRSLQDNQEGAGHVSGQYDFDFLPRQNQHFPYSIAWLVYDFLILVSMLFLINGSPVYIWIPATVVVVTIWVLRYKRGLRQLSKPSFWIAFALITMLTAFVITGLNHEAGKWLQGLITGLKMNFRAAVVIVGFAVLGTELYNPKIRQFFARTAFRQLPQALELAFESLPVIIHNLPEVSTFFKRPGEVIRRLVRLAEQRFLELKPKAEVILLTGDYAAGKTSFLKEMIVELKERKVELRGFYAPRVMDGAETIGYDLADVTTGETLPFLRKAVEGEIPDVGPFKANQATMDHFYRILQQPYAVKTLVILDEVGKWEAGGKGWHELILHLHAQPEVLQLWVVRDKYVELVQEKFGMTGTDVIRIDKNRIPDAMEAIRSLMF